MVGIKTTTKCDTCRTRKKKCTGEIPACSECIRSGWVCPGYKQEWRFVDETPRMKKHYATRKYVYSVSDSESDSDLELRRKKRILSKLELARRRENAEVSRFNGFDSLGSNFVYCLSIRTKGALLRSGLIDTYFEFIPSRLGVNPALDESIRCLVAIYSTADPTPFYLRRDVCQSYVKAIKALRKCLDDHALRMEPETLCSALLLNIFELVLHEDDAKWDHLTLASTRLLYARGVERYKTSFEMAMLESQFGFLFRQSARFKEPCFLRHPEWQSLIIESPRQSFHSKQTLSRTWRTTLCGTLLIHFSSILVDFENVYRDMAMNTPDWEDQADILIDRCFQIYERVKDWVETEINPVLISHPMKPGGDIIHYEEVVAGVVDCMAHIAIITTQKLLGALCFAVFGPKGPRLKQLEIHPRLEPPYVIERRLQRAESALEYVRGESEMSSIPLNFGLQHCRG